MKPINHDTLDDVMAAISRGVDAGLVNGLITSRLKRRQMPHENAAHSFYTHERNAIVACWVELVSVLARLHDRIMRYGLKCLPIAPVAALRSREQRFVSSLSNASLDVLPCSFQNFLATFAPNLVF